MRDERTTRLDDRRPPRTDPVQAPCASESHHLVAHLSQGLRSTYAVKTDDAVPDLFAGLLARLANTERAAR